MAEENFQEKTEKATPKKREETRKKGEVAKSRELTSVTVLLAGLFTLTLFGPYICNHVVLLMEGAFLHLKVKEISTVKMIAFSQEMIRDFLLILVPLLVVLVLAAIFSNILQAGFVVSGETIKPKISKLDPIKGFGRLFSRNSLMEFIKSLLKLAIIGIVAYISIKGEMKNAIQYGDMELNGFLNHMFYTIFKIFLKCAAAMILLVVIDYAYQKWEYEKRIKMSKQEVKEEFKRTEGDPQIKSRIRSIQREMARKRMR